MNIIHRTVVNQGKYVLRAKIGRGVFSITYRATHNESGETVAIKTLSDTVCKNRSLEELKANFLEHTPKLLACQHPHLVKAIDYFEEEGRPYLVQEYVTGKTLDELISPENPLSVPVAIDYIRQLAGAASSLHQHGLLHQDIRPHNIIKVRDSESLVLGELGIVSSLPPLVKQTQAKLQAAGYAPIERYQRSAKLTPASDIYSLAATLYFFLTGTNPVPAPVREEYQRIQPPHPQGSLGDPLLLPALRKAQPKIKSAIELAIWRGLEVDPQKRPQSVKAWLAMLPRLAYPDPEQRLLPKPPLERPQVQNIRVFSSKNQVDEESVSAPPAEIAPNRTSLSQGGIPYEPNEQIVESEVPAKSPEQMATVEPVARSSKKSPTVEPEAEPVARSSKRSPWLILLFTLGIGLSSGMGFGLALRQNRPSEPGATILHTEQSFPNRSPWPIQEVPAEVK